MQFPLDFFLRLFNVILNYGLSFANFGVNFRPMLIVPIFEMCGRHGGRCRRPLIVASDLCFGDSLRRRLLKRPEGRGPPVIGRFSMRVLVTLFRREASADVKGGSGRGRLHQRRRRLIEAALTLTLEWCRRIHKARRVRYGLLLLLALLLLLLQRLALSLTWLRLKKLLV